MPRERRAAGVLLYRIEGGRPRFLLLEARKGGHWSPPKGHLCAGEGDLEAALRETREETGLAPRGIDPDFCAEIHYEISEKGARVPKTAVYFLGEAGPGEVRLSDEHCDFRWAALEEALERIPHQNLRGVIEAASAHLRAKRGPF
jgi:bis(5'-nucleosidyl)-tetraphosphatase